MSLVKITYLPAESDRQLLRQIARWTRDEWIRDGSEATLDRLEALFAERAGSRELPLMVIAQDSSDPRDGQGGLVGFASLVASEMKRARPTLGPWLSGVYVRPESRGRGVGAELCRRIADEARRLGASEAYLYTRDQQALYTSLGWSVFSEEYHEGAWVTIMRLTLSRG